MTPPEEQELEDSFTALSYGLTLPAYRDARRIARMNPGVTQVTRLMALCMKHSPDQYAGIVNLVRSGMLAE